MIGIVTLNPCVDKTLFLPKLPREGIHTAGRVTCLAGGNGNNVARVLGALGVLNRSLVLVAGETGGHIRRLMAEEGLTADFVETPGMSRTVTTLAGADWRQLAVKEPGPQLTAGQAREVRKAFLNFLLKIDLLCVSTSVPCPALADFPGWAVGEAKKRGVPAVADTSGPALPGTLEAAPLCVKPNADELIEAGLLEPGGEAEAVRRLMEKGIERPVLSLGERGALAGADGEVLRVVPPEVDAVNPVGSGDSFVAGLLYGMERKLPWPDCLRWAAAAGAANAARWEAACLTRSEIEPLVSRVRVEREPQRV